MSKEFEFQGTRGKWEIRVIGGCVIVEKGKYNSIATVHVKNNFDINKRVRLEDTEAKANALLVSKAPEMLEMLQIINEGINTMDFTQLEILHPEIKQLLKEATTL